MDSTCGVKMCTKEETPGLPVVHPSMDVMEVEPQSTSGVVRTFQDKCDTPCKLQGQGHRVLKKRSLQALVVSTPKRRFSLKPKKVVTSTSNKNSENFFLGSKFKSIKKAILETIYEEPLTGKDGTVKYSGAAKLRRLNFDSIAKSKVKKRKTKAKKVLGSKYLKKKRMSMNDFISKLRGICAEAESEEIASLFTNCEIK